MQMMVDSNWEKSCPIMSNALLRIPLNPDTQSSRNRTVSPRESGHSVQ